MPCQMYSKFMFLFFIRYVRNRIDHWCTVEPGNPNPRVHRSSGKLGDPRDGIFLSPLNTNDGFSLSRINYPSPIGRTKIIPLTDCVISLAQYNVSFLFQDLIGKTNF